MESQLIYAFGHLVSGHARPDDAHSGDSLDEGRRVLEAMEDMPAHVIGWIEALAEHVAGDYEYTGEATEIMRRITAGEV